MPISAQAELRLHYLLFSTLPVLLLLPAFSHKQFRFEPAAKVLDAQAIASPWSSTFPGVGKALVINTGQVGAVPFSLPLAVFALLAACALLWGAFFVLRDYRRLRQLQAAALPWRKIGRVQLAVHDALASPLSFRASGHAWVILPSFFCEQPLQRRIALAHEIQHHRQGDTLWCHAFAPLRVLAYFHPLCAFWARLFAEIQELACDERLVDQGKISAGDYSRCLIEAANWAGRGGAVAGNAATLPFFSERRLLKRRIESMYRKKKNNKYLAWAIGAMLGVGLAGSAWASGQWLVDGRITRQEAEVLAAEAARRTAFPVEVNESVLHWLNHFLGSSQGRKFMASALENLEEQRSLMSRMLVEHEVPEELLAVGLVESGFRNLPASANPKQHGAGVWQFIPSSARVWGLRVDESVDERLDVPLETSAAFRYIKANQVQFRDWRLAIMAYNIGERRLQRAIQVSGTRDPWELIRRGYENDSGYLARFMAVLLILKSPQLVR